MSGSRLLYPLFLALLVLSGGLAPLAMADEDSHYDRVSLQATASTDVENDILEVTLSVYREGSNPSLLSEKVNADIRWAIAEAKQVSAVSVQTLGYQTNPIYQQQRLSGWRVRQSLRLESQDIAALSELVGRLQERLAVGRVAYRVSEQRRNTVEEALVIEAIDRFKQRAALVAKQIGRNRYRLVSMNINTRGGAVQPVGRAQVSMLAESASTPSFEAGVQTLQVSVSGIIELQLE